MRYCARFSKCNNFLLRNLEISRTHSYPLFLWVSNCPNCFHIFKQLNAYTELTFTLNGLLQTVHGKSHNQPETACRLLPMAPSVLCQGLICSQPSTTLCREGVCSVGRDSKCLGDNFQLNSRRVHLFALICSTDIPLRAEGLHILIENACFLRLTAWYFCHNSCCLQWVSISALQLHNHRRHWIGQIWH